MKIVHKMFCAFLSFAIGRGPCSIVSGKHQENFANEEAAKKAAGCGHDVRDALSRLGTDRNIAQAASVYALKRHWNVLRSTVVHGCYRNQDHKGWTKLIMRERYYV